MKPIFVMGVEHSGTTIVYRMLAQHPELCWCSNYTVNNGSYSKGRNVPFAPLLGRVARDVIGVPWKKRLDRHAGLKWFAPEPLESFRWNEILPNEQLVYPAAIEDSALAQELQMFVANECHMAKKARFLAKRPFLSRHVLTIDRAFPDARYVYLLRDGKAVALSLKAKFNQTPIGDERAFEWAADYWRELTVFWQDYVLPYLGDKVLVIRYEEFCENPGRFLGKIEKHCGLTPHSYRGVPESLRVTNERRYQGISLAVKKTVNTHLEPVLSSVGYLPFKLH